MKIQNIHFHRIFFALILIFLCGFGIQESNAQSVTVSGPTTMNVGQQATFSVSNSGTKYWSVSAGGNIISGQNTSNILVEATTGSNFTITVSINGGSGGYGGKTVSVAPLVPTTPTVQYQSCGAELVSAPENIQGVTWYWQGTNPNGESTSNPSTSNYTVNASGNYYLRARNSGGTWSISSAGKSVTMPGNPSIPSISNSTSREICLGGSTTFDISSPLPNGTYRWYSGSTQVGTGTSFTANPSSSGNKTYTVKVTSNQGCESNSRTVTVNVIDLSTPLANNGQNTCTSGNSVLVSVNNSRTVNGQVRSDMEHVWYSNAALTNITSHQTVSGTPGGTIATQKTVTLTPGQSQSFWVVSKVGSCYSDPVEVVAQSIDYSLNPGGIGAPDTICQNSDPDLLTSTSPASGGDGQNFVYEWQYSTNNSNWIPISNTNQLEYNPTENLTAPRYYRRKATSCGITDYTDSVLISVYPNLSSGGTINSNRSYLCYGEIPDAINNISLPTGGDDTYTYEWYYSENGTNWLPITGANQASYSPSNPLTLSRWYRRTAYSCNQSTVSNSFKITVSEEMTTPVVIKTDPDCTTTTGNITITSPTTSGYQYSINNGGTYQASPTFNNLDAGTYIVKVRNASGCITDPTTVQIISSPTSPLPPQVSEVTQPTCGENVGYFDITNYNSAYTYTIEPSNGLVSMVDERITVYQGSYTVKATYLGCTSNPSVERIINEPPFVPATPPSVTVDDSVCGQVTLTRQDPNTQTADVTWYWQIDPYDENTSNNTAPTITLTNGLPFHYLRARNNTSLCWGEALLIEFDFKLVPLGATGNDQPTNVCQGESATITANPWVYADDVRWYDAATGGNLLGTGVSHTITPTENTTLYAESYNTVSGCIAPTRTPFSVNMASNIIWYLDADGDGHPVDSQESCTSPGVGWVDFNSPYIIALDDCDDSDPNKKASEWYYPDSDGDGFRNPGGGQRLCAPPTEYTWTQNNIIDNCPEIADPSNNCGEGIISYTGHNYVYSRAYQEKTTSLPSDMFLDEDHYLQNITYFDGHGRAIQQNAIAQSTSGKDIIVHMEYDALGRTAKSFLPYAEADNFRGEFRPGAYLNTISFYNSDDFDFTANPFSETSFEESPLNRPLESAAPGNSWAMGNGHEVKSEYMTNTGADNVKWFEVSLNEANGDFIPSLVLNASTTYGTGTLTKSIVKDENWVPADNKLHTVEQFTNSMGQMLLKRHYGPIDINKDGDTTDAGEQEVAFDTYYVYDDYGNLTYVLPPLMNASTEGLSSIIGNLDALAYQYVYDERNRLIEKQLPGKEKESIVYNNLDQPIMVQDAVQQLSGEWLFTKYDAFGRVAYTGKAVDARYRKDIQDEVNGLTVLLCVGKGSFVNDGEEIGYLNTAYPTTTLTEVLTVNYYDDYSFDTAGATPPTTVFDESIDFNTQGLATGSKIKVLDVSPAQWVTNVTYYQEKGRPIYTYSVNDYLGTVDITETDMDFVGKPLKVKTTHERAGNSLVTIDFFEYDYTGRLLKQTQCINGDCGNGTAVVADAVYQNETITTDRVASNSITILPNTTLTGNLTLRIDPNATNGEQPVLELITYNKYDEIGQLVEKKVGGTPEANYEATLGLQVVDYDYNVRGWLKGINNETGTNQNIVLGSRDLFGYQMNYDNPFNFNANENPDALYNGNISQVLWKTTSVNTNPANQVAERYSYSYDALNRLTKATDNTTGNNYGLAFVTYDKNGNIVRLQRRGHINPTYSSFDVMDDLVYSYTGNQLTQVEDNSLSGFGFNDRGSSAGEYRYDINGNLVADGNKHIGTLSTDGIAYNHLNLPVNITVTDSGEDGTIGYIYDAVGNKLQKTVTPTGQSSLTTEYALRYIYENGVLQFVSTPEGYYTPPSGEVEGAYVYQYKDHLGNVRLSYTDDPSNPGTAVIVEENNYYPFGLQHKGYNMGGDNALGNDLAQKWKYGGKELDESLNGILSTYDFGARNYDPAIGRWMNIDPLAEKMRRHSPYNYAFNNPIFYIDPDGMEAYASNGYQDLDENEAWAQGVQVLQPGEGSLNITHTDSNGNKTTVSISSSDFNDVVGGNKGNSNLGSSKTKNSGPCTTPECWAAYFKAMFLSVFGAADNEIAKIAENGDLDNAFALDNKNTTGKENAKKVAASVYEGLTKVDPFSAANLSRLYLAATSDNGISPYYDGLNSYLGSDYGPWSDGVWSGLGLFTASLGGVASLRPTSQLFSMNNGYGLFGKSGLKIGNYTINALYANPNAGGGTYFSIKQLKNSGNLFRMDYGMMHSSGKMSIHATFRFNTILGKLGSSNTQLPIFIWNY